jgi:hypothetical protein
MSMTELIVYPIFSSKGISVLDDGVMRSNHVQDEIKVWQPLKKKRGNKTNETLTSVPSKI